MHGSLAVNFLKVSLFLPLLTIIQHFDLILLSHTLVLKLYQAKKDLPGYKLPSSRSRTPSDRFCSPACCASGTQTWLGTSSSDTPRTLATKRILFGSEYNPLACQCQCPQLRCELHGITFGFLDYRYKACESQYLTDALCPLGAV